MGYSEDDSMVRVDFFKSSGKWYETEAVKWTGGYQSQEQLIHDAFKQSLRDHFKKTSERLSGMDAVCLHPYHETKCPIMIREGGWIE